MKHNKMLSLINAIFEQVELMHTEGQKEYAMDEDNVFANFERIAEQTGLNRETVKDIDLKEKKCRVGSQML